jgi:hypothetical protein
MPLCQYSHQESLKGGSSCVTAVHSRIMIIYQSLAGYAIPVHHCTIRKGRPVKDGRYSHKLPIKSYRAIDTLAVTDPI